MKHVFVIVGVGGTGSLLARDIPKLLINTPHRMVIIDGDTVEEKNMVRQSYQKHDINENKALALSKKINTFYGNICEAIDKYVTKDEITSFLQKYKDFVPVLVGCVDNDKTRLLLESTYRKLDKCIYLDSANSEYEGNVYVKAKLKSNEVGALRSDCYKLSNDQHPADKSCEAQAAIGNTQYLVTNLRMATVLLEHISSIVHGEVKEGVTIVKRFEEIHY